MRHFLGVDIGATKSHALIAEETGRAVGFGESGPGNYESVGWDGLRQALHTITDRALAAACIAREQIAAQTRIMVANVQAEGEKRAAEIDAQAALEVAAIQQEVAKLEAKRTEILGQARADVEQMKNEAEAKGYKMLVDAFGSPRAYNLYTFAESFQPESIQLFFAGDGTFWTDLTRLQDAAALELLKSSAKQGE